MSNFGVMTAQILVLINNQLTTEQVQALINAAQIEEVENHPWCRIKGEAQINSFATLTNIPVAVQAGSTTVARTDGNTFPAITAGQMFLVVAGQTYSPMSVAAAPVAGPTATSWQWLGDSIHATFSKALGALLPGTIQITGSGISGSDNGLGSISGTGIMSGTVDYATGLVTVTFSFIPLGNAAINGTATNQAILTLIDPYPGPSAEATTASLFQMFYSVPGFQEVMGVRQQVVLARKTHEWINDNDPYRQEISGPAYVWAAGGRDSNDNAQVELWPLETASNGYAVYGLRQAALLVNPTDIPAIAAAVLVNKAAALCCDTLDALTGDPRWDRASKKYYLRYEKEWMKIQDSDANQFGTIYQIQDARNSPSASGYSEPALNQFPFTDYPSDWR